MGFLFRFDPVGFPCKVPRLFYAEYCENAEQQDITDVEVGSEIVYFCVFKQWCFQPLEKPAVIASLKVKINSSRGQDTDSSKQDAELDHLALKKKVAIPVKPAISHYVGHFQSPRCFVDERSKDA